MLVEVQVRAQFRARIPCQTNSTRTFMGVPTVYILLDISFLFGPNVEMSVDSGAAPPSGLLRHGRDGMGEDSLLWLLLVSLLLPLLRCFVLAEEDFCIVRSRINQPGAVLQIRRCHT
jgi:hypothetical protein